MSSDPTNPYGDEEDLESIDLNTLRPPEPSWGDVIGGIWDRLTNPLPRTT